MFWQYDEKTWRTSNMQSTRSGRRVSSTRLKKSKRADPASTNNMSVQRYPGIFLDSYLGVMRSTIVENTDSTDLDRSKFWVTAWSRAG